MKQLRTAAVTLLLAVLITSCGGDADAQRDTFEVTFDATVGDQPFSCSETYEGLGQSESTVAFSDLRFYVHDFKVIDSDGVLHDVDLVDRGAWQNEAVALLDFSDGSGHCINTPEARNRRVELAGVDGETVGKWRGIAFSIGVPFDANHGDMSTAESPLNLPSMFWSWNGGYKFMRLDMSVDEEQSFRVHLGSTGCMPANRGDVEHCNQPNRARVIVDDFDVENQQLRFDIARLLHNSDLSEFTENTGAGCLSGNDDPDCDGLFEVLGLDGPDQQVDSQVFFGEPTP